MDTNFSFAFQSQIFSDRVLILRDSSSTEEQAEATSQVNVPHTENGTEESKGLDDDLTTSVSTQGKEKLIPVNSIILAKGSHFFRALLTSEFQEKSSKEIVIEQPKQVVNVCMYIYERKGCITTTKKNEKEMGNLRREIQSPHAVTAAIQELKQVPLTPRICDMFLALPPSITHLSVFQELFERVETFLVSRFHKVEEDWDSEEFLNLSLPSLRLLLQSNEIVCLCENSVWAMCVQWINYEEKSKAKTTSGQRSMSYLYDLIRFGQMTSYYLLDVVIPPHYKEFFLSQLTQQSQSASSITYPFSPPSSTSIAKHEQKKDDPNTTSVLPPCFNSLYDFQSTQCESSSLPQQQVSSVENENKEQAKHDNRNKDNENNRYHDNENEDDHDDPNAETPENDEDTNESADAGFPGLFVIEPSAQERLERKIYVNRYTTANSKYPWSNYKSTFRNGQNDAKSGFDLNSGQYLSHKQLCLKCELACRRPVSICFLQRQTTGVMMEESVINSSNNKSSFSIVSSFVAGSTMMSHHNSSDASSLSANHIDNNGDSHNNSGNNHNNNSGNTVKSDGHNTDHWNGRTGSSNHIANSIGSFFRKSSHTNNRPLSFPWASSLSNSSSSHTNYVRTFAWDVPVTAVLALEMAQCYDSPPFISNGYWFDLFIKRDHYPFQSQRLASLISFVMQYCITYFFFFPCVESSTAQVFGTTPTLAMITETIIQIRWLHGIGILFSNNSNVKQQKDNRSCLGLYLEMLPNKSNLRMPFHLPKVTWSIYCRSHVDNGSYRYLRSAEKSFHSEMKPGFGFGHPNLFGVTWDQICEDTFDYCVNGLITSINTLDYNFIFQRRFVNSCTTSLLQNKIEKKVLHENS
ncbi:hypothetical protein RFI_13020 [Reticulomyxa filosa]|uniref:BTB domain-containing protein n=1 Tax=Reticulomyxa filosa TaxID=46433 RepID=X6NDQ7_RETFI|nr:hypothetical protein RFI_13020 [Reticulomyxa filosa]|eukprot:ETO24136.1 hypothetical protein RFI_13020 [Reticulomyxa filosa]